MSLPRGVLLLLLSLIIPTERAQTQGSIASIESLIRQGQYDQAVQSISTQLRARPNDEKLWTLQGIALSLAGDDQKALGAFERALKLAPDDPAAMRGTVELLYKSRDQRAVPILHRILRLDPADQTAHEMLGILERKSGDCPAAVEQFASSADAVEKHPGSLEAEGDCLLRTRHYQEAADTFRRLAARLPAESFPLYDEAVVLVEMKDFAAAARILDGLLARESVDADAMSLASEAYEGMGDTPRAVSLLRQAIVADPQNAAYYNSFVSICLNPDSYQVGIDMVNAGLARIQNNPSLYISRGLLYAELAQYDKAQSDFEAAERLDSAQSVSAYAADLTEMQIHHHPEAVLSKVRLQLKQHPESPMLHFVLADLLSDEQAGPHGPSLIEAQQEAEKAIALRPNYVEARTLLASLAMRAGDAARSAAECRQALKYDPNDQAAIYHLILALRHTGASANSAEVQTLVKRLSTLQQESLKDENERKRFRLVDSTSSESH